MVTPMLSITPKYKQLCNAGSSARCPTEPEVVLRTDSFHTHTHEMPRTAVANATTPHQYEIDDDVTVPLGGKRYLAKFVERVGSDKGRVEFYDTEEDGTHDRKVYELSKLRPLAESGDPRKIVYSSRLNPMGDHLPLLLTYYWEHHIATTMGTAHPMDTDTDTDTDTDIVNARTKRPRDDGDDDSDSDPRPSRRQCLQALDACTQGAGAFCTIVANARRFIWQRSASRNATNVQSVDQIPVVPARTMNNMITGPSRLLALSPSRNDAQQSPVAQQQHQQQHQHQQHQVTAMIQGPPASPQATQSTINVTNTSALPVKECFNCVWPGLLAFGWLCLTIFLRGMLRTWSEFEDDDLSTVCCVTFTLLVLTVLPLWIQYKSEYALVIKLVMVCLTLLVHAVFFTPKTD